MNNIIEQGNTELEHNQILDPIAVGQLFVDEHKPPRRMTRTVTFTIREEVDNAWRDFLVTFAGVVPQRGRGISSATVQLGMSLVMAVIASYKVTQVATMLKDIIHPEAIAITASNLRIIADWIEQPDSYPEQAE